LFLAASYFAEDADAVTDIDARCRAFALSKERLDETAKQGAAFARVTADVWGNDMPALTYPVAVGRAAFLANLPLRATASCYLHAFISNLISAAQRLMRLGQTDAQALVHALSPLCAEIARENADGDLTRISGTAFLADIAAMRHETQYSRIFQT
jgi:urease accessory protein